MIDYTVVYMIDVSAETHKEAALFVEHVLLHPHYRPALLVKSFKSKAILIDLDKE